MSEGASTPKVAVEPDCWRRDALADAVVAGGGEVVAPADASALVWAEPAKADLLPPMVDANPQIDWVQLPYAGIEPFIEQLQARAHLTWTCGKGVYAAPVAEHVIGLTLAGMRGLGTYVRATAWTGPQGKNLLGARVLVLGGGGITEHLVALLAPFGCHVDVVRNRAAPLAGATAVHPPGALAELLPQADVVVLALALTPATEDIIGATELELMAPHAWLINVARGRHVDTDALVEALRRRSIGGAALDVTDPEPLPDTHPLWTLDNAIITPHIANTPEMGLALLAERVTANIARRAAGESLIGEVDVALGY